MFTPLLTLNSDHVLIHLGGNNLFCLLMLPCNKLSATNYTIVTSHAVWGEVKMADEEIMLLLCASSAVTVIMKRRQKKTKTAAFGRVNG